MMTREELLDYRFHLIDDLGVTSDENDIKIIDTALALMDERDRLLIQAACNHISQQHRQKNGYSCATCGYFWPDEIDEEEYTP